jgi:hypothetical protein
MEKTFRVLGDDGADGSHGHSHSHSHSVGITSSAQAEGHSTGISNQISNGQPRNRLSEKGSKDQDLTAATRQPEIHHTSKLSAYLKYVKLAFDG